jgi:hypothetical protein
MAGRPMTADKAYRFSGVINDYFNRVVRKVELVPTE